MLPCPCIGTRLCADAICVFAISKLCRKSSLPSFGLLVLTMPVAHDNSKEVPVTTAMIVTKTPAIAMHLTRYLALSFESQWMSVLQHPDSACRRVRSSDEPSIRYLECGGKSGNSSCPESSTDPARWLRARDGLAFGGTTDPSENAWSCRTNLFMSQLSTHVPYAINLQHERVVNARDPGEPEP